MDEGWQTYFPACPDLDRSQAEEFALFLERLEEYPLLPAKTEPSFVVRLLCLPTWSRPCVVRVESHGLRWQLVGTELSGEAGFEVGEVVRRQNRFLSSPEIIRVEELWSYVRFWSLPTSAEEDVLDGTTYVLEAVERGRYHVVFREDLEWGENLNEFCELLLNLAGFAVR